MEALLSFMACLAAFASALAFYAASPHCRWRALRVRPLQARATGAALLVASAAIFAAAIGVGPGICAALGAWMLALVALPAFALRAGDANTDAEDA